MNIVFNAISKTDRANITADAFMKSRMFMFQLYYNHFYDKMFKKLPLHFDNDALT